MAKNNSAKLHELLHRIRSGTFGKPTVSTLTQSLNLNKTAVQQLLDILETNGLITKAPSRGIQLTGTPANQGHIVLGLAPHMTVQVLQISKASQPIWPHEKVYIAERLIYDHQHIAAFERHLFAPNIHLTGTDVLSRLSNLYLEPLVYTQVPSLLTAETQVGASPIPHTFLQTLEQLAGIQTDPLTPVVHESILRWSIDHEHTDPLWVTERWWTPGRTLNSGTYTS